MIKPKDLKLKSNALVESYFRAWYDGTAENMFPLSVKANLDPTGTASDVASCIKELRDQSKEKVGTGYSVQFRSIRSRVYGVNEFPVKIVFDSPSDLLEFTGQTPEFTRMTAVTQKLRHHLPELEDWGHHNLKILASLHDAIGDLILVAEYFKANPRPSMFARELPLPVHSKFVEDNERILREWLDRILPPASVSADEDSFPRRFGLKYVEPIALLRPLDQSLVAQLGFPHSVIGLTLSGLATVRLPPDVLIVVVENKVNLLTLPELPRSIAIGGMGNAVIQLAALPLFADRRVIYWGDIDAHGYEILDRFRRRVTQTVSILMDTLTLNRYAPIAVNSPETQLREMKLLTSDERAAYEICVTKHWRIEQERICQSYATTHFSQLFDAEMGRITDVP